MDRRGLLSIGRQTRSLALRPRWTRPQKRGIGSFPADGEEGRTVHNGWRKDVDSLSGRLAERYRLSILSRLGKGWKVGGQWPRVPRLLISCLPPPPPSSSSSFFFLLPASIKWAGNSLSVSRSARAKQGFFSQISTWRWSVVWSMGGSGTRAWDWLIRAWNVVAIIGLNVRSLERAFLHFG